MPSSSILLLELSSSSYFGKLLFVKINFDSFNFENEAILLLAAGLIVIDAFFDGDFNLSRFIKA